MKIGKSSPQNNLRRTDEIGQNFEVTETPSPSSPVPLPSLDSWEGLAGPTTLILVLWLCRAAVPAHPPALNEPLHLQIPTLCEK